VAAVAIKKQLPGRALNGCSYMKDSDAGTI